MSQYPQSIPPVPTNLSDDKSFGDHVRATMVLGLPLVGAQVAQMAIGVTDTIMIGWLGAQELAASVLGTQLFFMVYIFGAGLAFAVIPISANALGSGDERAVRRCVRMGLWAVTIFSVFGLAVMMQSNAIYIFLGQELGNILLAEDYLRIAMWGLLPSLLGTTLRSFLTALELARIVLFATIGGVVLNIFLNYILIFGNLGAPRLELVGAAWASVGTQTLILVILIAYIYLKKQTREYGIFTRIWIADWPAMGELFRLGTPMSIAILAEVGLFHAASIMMGWIGTIPLAAHGVALQIAAVAFMIPLGFGNAATVRIGNAFGKNNLPAVGKAGYAAIFVVLLIAVFAAALLLFWPQYLTSLFLDLNNPDAAEVLAYAVPLILVAAAFQFADSLQGVLIGALRGLKDIKVPMKLGIISYWLVGVPSAYILAFPLKLGGVGLWIGLAFGLTVASVLLMWRFYHRERLGLLDRA
ncbi:MAG: MATE family efflux transporter [Hyphomicrobiales bacterium]|nr:MATE family efflux transporter [Hyphomicrobiales bacterium]